MRKELSAMNQRLQLIDAVSPDSIQNHQASTTSARVNKRTFLLPALPPDDEAGLRDLHALITSNEVSREELVMVFLTDVPKIFNIYVMFITCLQTYFFFRS
jgi:hypothetical protein